MSAQTQIKRQTIPALCHRKGVDGTTQPIVMLTAYTSPIARMLDPHVDMLLVGDSLGMVVYGHDNTLQVDLDTMIRHGQAVMRGSQQACVVVDMPFGSYQESTAQAFQNAARVLAQTGCSAIKMEGGVEIADTIRHLTRNGIPVIGHVGLMPQRIHAMGGFRAQGRDHQQAQAILADARAVAEAGAAMIVVEGVVEQLAISITRDVPVPIIGIGASAQCDGQVLVTEDVLGLYGDFKPKFAKRYADLGLKVSEAAAAYAAEVRGRQFPAPEHCFQPLQATAPFITVKSA